MKFKRNRAKFSAPTPPEPPPTDDVVENQKPDKKGPPAAEEVIKPEPEPVEPETVVSPPAAAPTPPAKVVSRQTTKDKGSSIDQVLSDTPPPQPEAAPEKATPEEPQPQQLPETEMPMPGEKSSSNFLLIMITVFALVLGLAGWLLYFNASGSLNLSFLPGSTPQATPTPEPTVAPTPTPNVRADVVLDVLNGSGVAGAAGATAGKLEERGYGIATIGNAANQNFAESEVYTGADLDPDAELLLLEDLEDLFGTATVSGVLSESTSTASARITVGKDWAE